MVLADEPTGELDGDTEQQVIRLLAEHAGPWCRARRDATHSAEVARMADRVLTLTDGQLSA